ncbi:MAG: septum formation initiator family protein [Clostridia bacterium]|nr:septum formation initiator family protein [Clostridia bacterium]
MKNKEKKNSRSFILTLAIIAVMGYFVISLISLQMDIRDKQREVTEAQQVQQEKQAENEELEKFLTDGDESSYIERIARDVLGYVLPGERVYYDISSGE